MNMATCDRTGPNTGPLTLNVDKSNETDSVILGRPIPPRFPALGTMVCAIGMGGWRYIGPVTSVDKVAGTYTILPMATNAIEDKIKRMGLGAKASRSTHTGESSCAK